MEDHELEEYREKVEAENKKRYEERFELLPPFTFDSFKAVIREVLVFREDWDSESWNQSYMAFKDFLLAVKKEWLIGKTAEYLVKEHAKEFYQDATSDTHDYWIRTIEDDIRESIDEECERTDSKPGFGTAKTNHDYNGNWLQ